MEARFQVSTWGLYDGDTYDYTNHIVTDFVCKLADIILPFGYVIYPRQYRPSGGVVPSPDSIDGEDSTTSKAEAQKLKSYVKDFCIQTSDGTVQSRWLRIESRLAKKPPKPIIGVVNELDSKKNKFRGMTVCNPGRAEFLNSRYQDITRGNINLKWNELEPLNVKRIFYFNVIVNSDMLLVFGGGSPSQSEACIYGNYISFIRLSSVERPNKVKWVTNGLMSLNEKEVIVDVPVTQKAEPPYARIGNIFKCAEMRGHPAEWIYPGIIVLPRVSTFGNDVRDENYTLFFTNEYNNHSGNKLVHLDSISMLFTKPCLVLI